MSQSWDNVASMHDHLLTVHAHKHRDVVYVQIVSCLQGQDCPLVPCTCADWSGCRGHTPYSKQLLWLQLSVQWRRSRSAWMLLPRTNDSYDKEQTSPLALLGYSLLSIVYSWRAGVMHAYRGEGSTLKCIHFYCILCGNNFLQSNLCK